jgi:hypothetical protein
MQLPNRFDRSSQPHPTYSIALKIATKADRQAEFTNYFSQIDWDAPTDLESICTDWDKWRQAYPEVPSYQEYLFTKRYWNSRPKKSAPFKPRVVFSQSKPAKPKSPPVKISQGLEIATRYGLGAKYRDRAGFPVENFEAEDRGFWQWIAHYPQIVPGDFDDILNLDDFKAFEVECIQGSDIRRPIFDLNVQRIVNTAEDRYAVLDALNIPIARSYLGDEDGWNRPEHRFGGEVWAFKSSRSGLFNCKPRVPEIDRSKDRPRKYEAPRKHKITYPEVTLADCRQAIDCFGLPSDLEPGRYWQQVLAYLATNPAPTRYPTISSTHCRQLERCLWTNLRVNMTIEVERYWETVLFFLADLRGQEGNKVFFPDVDRISCDLMRQRFGIPIEVTPANFWEVVVRYPKLIPFGITEGAKKALSLISEGFPCVAVYGIANWSISGSSNPRILLPELANFAAGNRQIDIWYDRENETTNLKTFLNVKAQAARLRNAAIESGANKKSYPIYWDLILGKGIDDAKAIVRASGQDVAAWLSSLRTEARPSQIYDRIEQMYALSPDRQIVESAGDRFPDRDYYQLDRNIALIGDTGAGKTHQIRKLVNKALLKQIVVIIFTPTNKLGMQLAGTLGLPHRNCKDIESGETIDIGTVRMLARQRGGLVMCPDSLPVFGDLVKGLDYLVVCDEAAKIIEHISGGHTLGHRYSPIVQQFADLLSGSQLNVMAEAKISEQDLQVYEQLCGKESQIYRHKRQTAKRKITMLTGNNKSIDLTMRERIIDYLAAGERVIITSDSQRKCEAIERILQTRFPAKKGIRNDALTSYIPDVDLLTKSPNEFLATAQLDYLIYSPACKAGWDLTAVDYQFDRICCLFSVLPTSDHIQMLGRYRPNIPIDIACREVIPQYKDEIYHSTKQLQAWHQQSLAFHSAHCGIDRPTSPLQDILMDQYRFNTIRNGLEKSIARYSLSQRLIADGHQVSSIDVSLETIAITDPERYARLLTADLHYKDLTTAIDREWADLVAATPLRLDDDFKIADALERLDAPTPAQRAKAFKIRLRDRFPGVDLDLAEPIYYGTRHRGLVSKGADLAAQLSDRELVMVQQRVRNQGLLSEDIVPVHRLRQDGLIVSLMLDSGILDLIGAEYSQESSELKQLQDYCLRNHANFKNLMGLSFLPGQETITFYQRLLRKMGLSAVLIRRSGSDGQRCRWYKVLDRQEILINIESASNEIEAIQAKIDRAKQLLPEPDDDIFGLEFDRCEFLTLTGQIDRFSTRLIDLQRSISKLNDRYIDRSTWELFFAAATRRLAQAEQKGDASTLDKKEGLSRVDAKINPYENQPKIHQLDLAIDSIVTKYLD